MAKLIHNKYPHFPHKVTSDHLHAIIANHSYIASNFIEELKRFEILDNLCDLNVVFQFPFSVEVDESEQIMKAVEERREIQKQRMRDQIAKTRQEKVFLHCFS